MTDQEWAQATTPQKLEWLRNQLQEHQSYLNGLSARQSEFERRVTAQVLQMVDQIGELTATVEKLEAQHKG